MPRYDFQCGSCGAIFEETRAFAEAGAPSMCPSCHAQANRLLHVPTLVRASDGEPASAPDPTKPHPAWNHVAGCACGCGGGVIRPMPAGATTNE